MDTTLIISLAAIAIALASFVFSLIQYHRSKKDKILSKTSELLSQAFSLRKSSQNLRDKISVTDDMDDCGALLDIIDHFVEKNVPRLLKEKGLTVENVFALEKSLLGLELEFSLLVKQINVCIDFNEELVGAGFEPLANGSSKDANKHHVP